MNDECMDARMHGREEMDEGRYPIHTHLMAALCLIFEREGKEGKRMRRVE